MGMIDREGTFRGKILDHGVSSTKNDFPQFVTKLQAAEIYDFDEQVWVDWTDQDENEITAYLVMFGSKGETANYGQVKTVFSWDGADFQVLAEADYSELIVQFRVAPDTYEGKTRLKVQWIDTVDATPGSAVKKLDAKDLKALTAKYKNMMKVGAKPVKAGAKKPVAKKAAAPKSPGIITQKDKKEATAPVPAPVDPDVTPPPPPEAPDGMVEGHCTKDEAWGEVTGLKMDSVDDEKLATTWLGAITTVAKTNDQEKVTDEQWFQIKTIVNKECAQF